MSGVYPASARVFRPWKNGGGTTAEILCWPEGAGFDDFTLRLSTARVEASGPFSEFPGVDRVLTVIEGGAMGLHLGGQERALAPLVPFGFAGDVPCTAQIDAALLDFNVMTRRPLQARVTCGPLDAHARFALLLAPVAGLQRLDLLDLAQVDEGLRAAVAGAPALSVRLSGAL